MTGRISARLLSLVLPLGLVAACGPGLYEVPIETAIQATLDVSAFQRVLVAGFVSGGTDEVDGNLETVRLLRSQLRMKSHLRVIDADPLPLADLASKGVKPAESAPPARTEAKTDNVPVKDEKDMAVYEQVFANVDYWKRIGEEFQNPLIVTGTVLFMSNNRSGFVQREQETYDAFGRRRVTPVRAYTERKGFALVDKFVFIDGRTGATIHSETFREERLYNQDDSTPALSSYFELMDEVLPKFLNTLSTQKVRGTRVLIK
jgi:hypothetical protein